MSVYVDDHRERRRVGDKGTWVFSHMIADTRDELDSMAEKIELDQKWKVNAGEQSEHFDVTENYRQRAIKEGAIPITVQELSLRLILRNLREYLEGRS